MFERNEIITELTNALLEHVRGMREGDMIAWEAIEAITGLQRSESRFRTVTNKMRKIALDELGYTFLAEQGVGLRISKASDFDRDIVQYRLKRATNQQRRGSESLTKMRLERLPERLRPAAVQAMDELDRLKKENRIAMRLLVKRDE